MGGLVVPGGTGLGAQGAAGDLPRRRETPAPVPRPSTHAGFMVVSSELPRRARRGCRTRSGVDEISGPQGPAAGTATPRLKRGA